MYGNTETGSSASVSLTLASGPGSFTNGSTTTVAASNGLATFNNLILDTAGAYTLKATSGTLTTATSTSITIGAATASKLVWTTSPPSTGTAATAFGAVVTIEDQYGNTANSSASVTIGVVTGPTGAASISGATVSAVSGVATFSNLILDTAGAYTLKATSGSLAATNNASITINVGTASQLVFTTQPASTTAGTAFGAVVTVEDAGGNTVASASGTVTMSLNSEPTGASFATGSTTTATLSSGVATFSNLILDTAGSYTLKAAFGALTATSTSITIGAATASQLVWTTSPPSTGTAGTAFGAVVTIEDKYNNTVSSTASVTIGVATGPTGASITGTTAVNAVGGVATFSNLILNTVGSYTLTASSGSLTPATSTGITINVGAASKLVFTTEPASSGTAGTAFGAVVKVEDAGGNTVTSASGTVTISLNSGPAGASFATGSTTTATLSSGVATFSNLILDTAGTYTLKATSGTLTPATSTGISVGAAIANKLAFTTEPPSSDTAGTVFSAVVTVEDQYNNTVTNSSASVTIASTPTGVSGKLTVSASSGVATFSNLLLNTLGSYTLTATSGTLTSATSNSISISSGPPSKLVFTTGPPSTGTAGTSLSPAVVVTVEDAEGNTVTSSSAQVTIASSPAGVSGTLTVSASSGVATFSNLLFNAPNSYTLTASSGTLTPATSTGITISVGPASKLVFTTEPPPTGTAAGTAFGTVVTVEDAGGNVVTSSSASITLTPSSGSWDSSATPTVSAVNGVATFTNLILDTAGNYMLTASSGTLTAATSTTIVIGAAVPYKLAFTTQPPSSDTVGADFGAAVTVEDQYGNKVTNSSASVTIASTPAGVSGTLTVAASSGVATFSGLSFSSANTYTLTATSGTLTSATSASIDISAQSGVNNANLKGTYVCKINGYNDSDGSSWASLSSVIANGSGGLTSGIWDQNGPHDTTSVSGTITGTYSIGADNNGVMTTTSVVTSGGTGSNTSTWAVALTNATSPAQQLRMVETDDVGSSPSGQHSTGNCYLATTSAFALSTFNGGYVVSINGTNGSGTPEMAVGRVSVSSGNITGGVVDDASASKSSVEEWTVTGGSFTTPDSTYGRSTLTIATSSGSGTDAVYIIDANRMFILGTGALEKTQYGDVRKQQQTTYSAANLDGPIVFYATGYEYTSGSVAGYKSNVYRVTGNGSGGITVNQSYDDNGGTYSAGNENGGPLAVTFDSSNPGRATFSPGNGTFYLYMFDKNSALEMNVTSSGDPEGAGWVEPQSQTTFTDAAVAGNYMVGQ